jgi:hypothetical protein
MAGAARLPLTATKARALLREAARNSERVVFTDHAVRQMRQRRIGRAQVLRCLGGGRIAEGPAPDVRGRWSCRVEGMAEGRGIAVAVGFESPGIVVITAFWMD